MQELSLFNGAFLSKQLRTCPSYDTTRIQSGFLILVQCRSQCSSAHAWPVTSTGLPEAAHGDAAQHVVSDELTYLLALVTRVVHANVLERAFL